MCGTGNCTLKIPIVGTTVGIPLPPCPLPAGSIDNSTTILIPAAPAGLPKTTVKGTFSVVDDKSANIAAGSVTATIAA